MTGHAREPSLRGLRLVVLATAAMTAALVEALRIIGMRFTAADTGWVALPLVLAAADLVLVPSVGSTVRPLPRAATEQQAQLTSLRMVRAITYFRLVLAGSPAMFGIVGSFAAHSLMPGVVGCGASVVLLLGLVYPRRGVLVGLRQRLESGGVASHLPT